MVKDFRPTKNQVLIKMESNESVDIEGGHKIYIPPKDKQQNDQEFVPLRGEVVAVPESLYFKQGDHTGLKWKTQMELQIGDKVIVKRPALTMALSKDAHYGSWFEENNEIFYFLRYDEIILARRGEQIIPLNSFLIVKPLQVNYNTSLLIPDSAKKDSMSFGTIKYFGSKNTEYHITKNSKHEDVTLTDEIFWVRKEDGEIKIDLVDLQEGDLVQFPKSSAIPVEPEIFRTLGAKDEKLYRMQRFNIIAKL